MPAAVCNLVVALLFAGCTSPQRVISGVQQYGFDGGLAEQRELERRATAGDSQAAIRVGRYYEMVEHDFKAALHWFDLGARSGDRYAAYRARKLREALRDSGE